jgi:hypothetical protein
MNDSEAFLNDTLHRMCVGVARLWVIEHHLRTDELPDKATFWVYANGPVGIGWGDAPEQDDPDLKPLRYKRICVTLEIEDQAR